MAFWNRKKKRTTAKITASVSKANLEERGILEYRAEIEDGFIVC